MNLIKLNMGRTPGDLTLLQANNKGRGQPAHPRSLVSTYVICYLQIYETCSEIKEDRFSRIEAHIEPACRLLGIHHYNLGA